MTIIIIGWQNVNEFTHFSHEELRTVLQFVHSDLLIGIKALRALFFGKHAKCDKSYVAKLFLNQR